MEGDVTKRLYKITSGVTLDYRGWETNLVQPSHRQSIKRNPRYLVVGIHFFGAKRQIMRGKIPLEKTK